MKKPSKKPSGKRVSVQTPVTHIVCKGAWTVMWVWKKCTSAAINRS